MSNLATLYTMNVTQHSLGSLDEQIVIHTLIMKVYTSSIVGIVSLSIFRRWHLHLAPRPPSPRPSYGPCFTCWQHGSLLIVSLTLKFCKTACTCSYCVWFLASSFLEGTHCKKNWRFTDRNTNSVLGSHQTSETQLKTQLTAFLLNADFDQRHSQDLKLRQVRTTDRQTVTTIVDQFVVLFAISPPCLSRLAESSRFTYSDPHHGWSYQNNRNFTIGNVLRFT